MREQLMAIFTTVYVGYGVRLLDETLTAKELEKRLEKNRWPEVDFLMAGDYDKDKPYLTTFMEQCELGEYKTFGMVNAEVEESWDAMLNEVMEHNGWPWQQATWFIVADQS